MEWVCSVKEGRKKNGGLVCVGRCQESLVPGEDSEWQSGVKTAKQQKKPGE